MKVKHIFSFVVFFNMDDWKDFCGQRPALVTSDASQQSPGNKSVSWVCLIFFIYISHGFTFLLCGASN